MGSRLVRWRWVGYGTRAVCHDAVAQLGFGEVLEGVRGAANFKSADTLVVFAFEEEVHFWRGGTLAFERGTYQGGGELRRGGEVVEGLASEDRGLMDIRLDKVVGGFDGGALQWKTSREVGHRALRSW